LLAIFLMMRGRIRVRQGFSGRKILRFAAIGVVVQLKDALNIVWKVKEKSGGGLWSFARKQATMAESVNGR
jgi:membrane protein